MNDARLFKLAVEQTKDYALFLLDPQGHIATWNAGAQRIKGYLPEDIIGRHFSVFYTRDAVDSGWPAYELKMATREGRFEDEGWRVRKDGSRFWANVVITALRDEDGSLLGFSKITRDLTERRNTEETLRQSEERFRLLVEGVVDYAVFMLDPDGVVTSWNTGAQRIKGYRPEEIIGRHFSTFYLDEDIQAGKPWAELAEARNLGHAEDEGWRVRKDGSRFWARVVVSPLRDATGKLRGFSKVTQDLSQRQHVRELEKAAQNLNEFIAVLAHELRNPLAPIRNAAHVFERVPCEHPAHGEAGRMIGRQSAQLSRIVEDMIDISRIARGAMVMEKKRVELADVVRWAVETANPAIEASRHRLSIDTGAEPLFVHGDGHRLAQLLANLLGNAARYTPPAGNISVRVEREAGMAIIRVRDDGRGIAPDQMQRIFDMFVQGRGALQRVSGGLGIGLALSRKIAELHGGSLTAASEGENRGSEFTVRLPLAADAGRAEPEDLVAQPPSRRPGRRILVVDDNADAAQSVGMLLDAMGHKTTVVYDGVQALKAVEEFQPEIVLLDLGMPGVDGYEVARQLRASSGHRPLRIVALTGWGQASDKERTEAAGFDLHLLKPVEIHELERVIA